MVRIWFPYHAMQSLLSFFTKISIEQVVFTLAVFLLNDTNSIELQVLSPLIGFKGDIYKNQSYQISEGSE